MISYSSDTLGKLIEVTKYFIGILLLVYRPNLHIKTAPTIINGGIHPISTKTGNIKFPDKAPRRPNINAIATIIVLNGKTVI